MKHKYLVAVRYSEYEESFRTFFSRKEAEVHYNELLTTHRGYELYFCKIEIK